MKAELAGKVAVVTGAGSGIGRGSAIALHEAGANVVLNDIDEQKLVETRALLSAGPSCEIAVGDVGDVAAVVSLFELAARRFGGTDIVHANAGVEHYEALETTEPADIDRLLRVDLVGCLLCMKYAIEPLRRRGGGSIIATASVQATHSMPGCVTYAAAKAGVVAAVRTLALEVGRIGIRVNAVSPGTIATPMLARDEERAKVADPASTSERFQERLNRANALLRVGTVAEIGAAVVYLASEKASYVTGTNLVVDGGFTAVKGF